MGVLGSGPLNVDKDHPSPVERATDHDPDFDRVSHHMSVFPSLFRSPVKHWFLTGVLGSGPSQIAVVQPLPVESPTDQPPAGPLSGEDFAHHTSVIPSPSRSPVKHCHAKRITLGSGAQEDVDHPLPVERPADEYNRNGM